MKKFKNLLFCLIACVILFSSCAVEMQQSNYSGTYEKKYLYIECFQTFYNTSEVSSCLAKDSTWDVYYIVNMTCPTGKKTEVYYDGKSLNGSYVFVGTYTYENKNGDSKTVRAYMPEYNFREWQNYNKDGLISLLDVLLSYNALK